MKTGQQLTVYQHPTLTVLIDDSQAFLDSVQFYFASSWTSKAFYDARSAVEWLLNTWQLSFSQHKESIYVGYDEETDSMDHRSAMIDMRTIYHIVKNPERFKLPAVLIVDYSMPGMNGLEFCAAIKHLPCKKILLTGQVEKKIIIDAFNRKLIDRYLPKNDSDVLSRLKAEVKQLQNEFFFEQSSILNDLLSHHAYSFLAEPAIAQLAEQLSEQHRFIEHYLFPNPGGILFFDTKGKPTLMVIQTHAGLTTQFEIAEDQEAPVELLDGLRERRLLPFFSDSGGCYRKDIVGDDWLSYCLPPQVCNGQQDYYWGLFDLPAHYLQGAIYSYEEYLQQHEAL